MTAESKGGIGHHAAHSTLKQGRQVFAFAERGSDRQGQQSFRQLRPGRAAPARRDLVAGGARAMVLAAYELGMPSMALAIMLGFATGQREADYLAMTHRHYAAIQSTRCSRKTMPPWPPSRPMAWCAACA
jgi:hypothetical protein